MKVELDWLAIDMVCQGTRLALKPREKLMVVRRMKPRMLSLNDPYWSQATAAKITAEQLAERLNTTARSVQRMLAELPPATKSCCPVCHQTMWIIDATQTVEAHADALFHQCPMSGRAMLTGLAAHRPDLYQWAAS